MSNKPIVGIGRVLLWSGGSLWIGRATGHAQAHAHHAIQISMGLTGRLRLCGEDDQPWREHAVAMVQPHQRHQFDGSGETVAQIFVEPETAQGHTLLQSYGAEPITDLPVESIEGQLDDLLQAFNEDASDEALVAISRQIVDTLCGQTPPALSVDPRISRAIEFMRARLGEPVTLAQAAAAAHLSPSRFRHLFVAQTGMSLRTYLLWARVEAAVGAAMGGQSWTDAAQDWGFADSAHLSRTCRRMFGIAPTMLVRP
ncbi:helix-turn-helix transcriptional regulator [Roseateles sp. NT4]|uniref:helix-turn-helix transcriptional regulator n=1 Tax=Roseateles sp. NT4 TaxID=3453715 RepID=UPI003EED6571